MATSSTTKRNVALAVDVSKLVEGLQEAGNAAGNFHKTLIRVTATLVAFKVANTAIQSLRSLATEGVRTGAVFERAAIQLGVFIGDSERAAKTMDFLTFQSTKLAGGLEDLIKGSTALETFGLNTEKWLGLVADAAQATGRQVEDVAIAFGRIAIGDPRTKQFLTTRRGDLLEFNKVLEETGSRLRALEAAFVKFKGVSDQLEGSFFRLAENLGDFLFIAAEMAGRPIFRAAKDALTEITDYLREEIFTDQGTRRKENVFTTIGLAIEGVLENLEVFGEVISGIGDPINQLLLPFFGKGDVSNTDAIKRQMQKIALVMKEEVLGGGPFSLGIISPAVDQAIRDLYDKAFGLTPEKIQELRTLGEDNAKVFLRGINTGLTAEQLGRFEFAVSRTISQSKKVAGVANPLFEAMFTKKDITKLAEGAVEIIAESRGAWNAGKKWREFFYKGIANAETAEEKVLLKDLLTQTEIAIRAENEKSIRTSKWYLRGMSELRKGPGSAGDPIKESKAEAIELERIQGLTEAQIKSDIEAMQFRWQLEEKLDKLKRDHYKSEAEEEVRFAKEVSDKRREIMVSRLGELGSLYSRYLQFDIFSLFGGNEGLDRQIEALKEELDILNGINEPLTRQAALQQRIVELESQRISVIDRLAGTFRTLANDIANAAAKAALLNLILGGGGGGFMSLFKTALGVASIFTPLPAGINLGLATAASFTPGGFQINPGTGVGIRPGGMGIPSPKPAISGVFIGQDAVPMIERAVTLAGRRATYA